MGENATHTNLGPRWPLWSDACKLLLAALFPRSRDRQLMSVARLSILTALFLCLPSPLVRDAEAQDDRTSMGFEVGNPFPTLAFPSLEDGQPRSITEFRGKKLILHVFASW